MKLFELIEPRISSADIYRSNKGLKHVQDRIAHNPNTKFLGKGSYGQAVQYKARPGAVIKSGIVGNLEDDGYFRYISVLAKNKWFVQNPYFPRVYSIKMYNNDNESGDEMYIAEIEQLTPLKDVSAETLMAIGDRAFYDFDRYVNADMRDEHGFVQGKGTTQGRKSRRVPKLQSLPQEKLSSYAKAGDVGAAISRIITTALTQNDTITMIKDPLLKQALMVVKKLNQRGREGIDTHMGNLMVRHGPGGGQLVLTDPIL